MATEARQVTSAFEAQEAPELDPDLMRRMLENMLLARAVDERMWQMNRAGEAPFAVSGQGHEAAQAGVAAALDTSKDWCVPYYRDITLSLAFGLTAKDLLLAQLARADDPSSGGRQMPNHFSSRKHRILSGSSVIATQIPHAAGIAFAAKARGEDSVTVVCFGEGATSQGDFHEGVNFATIYDLPVIFFCQNNEYAISVPTKLQMGVERVADRAAGYNMPGVRVDGLDAVEVYLVAREAVQRARSGGGPTLIEAMVRRFNPHSSDDDDRTYRPLEELEGLRADGPIRRTAGRLKEMGIIDDAWLEETQRRVRQEVNEATREAEAAPLPDPETFDRHVYFEG
ncbi:MAG TPA: thiamine pyrophosphate-dependent dehydrogenase E1 component subunit alpha [Thermomicrobiales bacterium]|nr:thiamine pyrophosphate-dependent dehydrogenase E1 component subunit alpha [Thermomicrobiales bacterium]